MEAPSENVPLPFPAFQRAHGESLWPFFMMEKWKDKENSELFEDGAVSQGLMNTPLQALTTTRPISVSYPQPRLVERGTHQPT